MHAYRIAPLRLRPVASANIWIRWITASGRVTGISRDGPGCFTVFPTAGSIPRGVVGVYGGRDSEEVCAWMMSRFSITA